MDPIHDLPPPKFDPLSFPDPASESFNEDVMQIVDGLVPESSEPDHWTALARNLLASRIAAAID